jgi:Na+/H+-dicarboxylate symporter
MVHILRPGAGLHLAPPKVTSPLAGVGDLNLKDFVAHVVPASIVQAMASNEILQIVVFAVLFGVAVAAVEDRAPAVVALAEQVAQVMLKLTGYVMLVAPLAIFAALASTLATQGPSVLVGYAGFVGGFYLSLGILWSIMFAVAWLAVGRRSLDLAVAARDPAILAFSTGSSEAAYPRLLEGLERFGTFAVLFIAQAYGIHLSLIQQLTMLLVLMVTSKGIAGVPRAALVVVAATLPVFHLPEGGVLLILAVDHLLDMGRSATNVIGNSLAATLVARWEGELGPAVAAGQGATA